MRNILAIETSCDETSAAVVRTDGLILSNIIASQIDTHKMYGGVIPEIASRMHVEAINITIEQALAEAKKTIKDISAIAVTQGPGLLGALLVGIQAAKTLAYLHGLPLITVNHMEGHICANFISEDINKIHTPDFPYLCLVVSGGHTQIVIAESPGKYKTLGRTADDAAGECYDKVARLLKLGYPGGPLIDKLSRNGNPLAIKLMEIKQKPEPGNYAFSFSGLKTAVLNYTRKHPEINTEDLCASFQKTVVDILVGNTLRAALDNNIKHIYIAGGVAANGTLRSELKAAGEKENIQTHIPDLKLCTDNAAMIAGAAIFKFKKNQLSDLVFSATPNMQL